jgi:hypothetical protein
VRDAAALDGTDIGIDGARDSRRASSLRTREDHHLALQRHQRAHGPADRVADVTRSRSSNCAATPPHHRGLEPMFCPPVLQASGCGDSERKGAAVRGRIRTDPMSQEPDKDVLCDVLRRSR